jgi:cell division protein FtsI/penicillin-binding protein 2
LYVNPEEVEDINKTAQILAKHTSIIEWRIKDLIRKRKKRYALLWKRLSIETSEEIEKYIKEEKDALKRWIIEKKDTIWDFIILEPVPRRYYPEWKLAAQVIGFVDNSWKWQYWLEGYFNDILKWNKGYIIAKVDIRWRTINPINFKSWDLYWKWAKIYSTIDRNIQAKVEQILEAGVKKFRANKGTVVVMNPKTWAILAMANYPSYDPNFPWKVYELEKLNYAKYNDPLIDLKGYPIFVEDSKNWKEFYYNSKKIFLRKATEFEIWNPAIIKYKYKNWFWPEVYRNGAISDLYEPGSIMKAFTVAIWLDSWEINQYSMYQDNWEVTIDQFKISNVSKKCLWYHTFGHALNYSCNVWMLRIAQRYGRVLAYEYLKKFWFWRKTNISLNWEVSSEIRELNHWSLSNLLTSSYGLWISVTPLQMATAYSVLANGWVYMQPHIVDTIKYPNWKILKYKPEESYRVIKPETSRIITKMLVDSINNWVAKNWNVEWYTLAWKTGTSQIAKKWWYEKWQASTYASFAWFWPAEDPKFVIIVKLDRPRTSIYGWATSAKIFKEIASFLLDYYKIPKKK